MYGSDLAKATNIQCISMSSAVADDLAMCSSVKEAKCHRRLFSNLVEKNRAAKLHVEAISLAGLFIKHFHDGTMERHVEEMRGRYRKTIVEIVVA